MFPMPDGTMVNSIDINTSGRIFAGGLGNINFDPTFAAVLTESASINVGFDDALDSAIFFNEPSPGLAVITWMMGDELDPISLGSLGQPPFIMQAQLFQNGDIVMLYDDQVQLTDCLVGVTPGTGEVGVPVSVDLSTAPTAAITPATATAAEEFVGVGIDLMSTALTFTALGGGNYLITGVNGIANPASAVPGRAACGVSNTALTFIPTFPGYLVIDSGAFDPTFNITGTAQGSGDDSILPLGLSFPFQLPGQLPSASLEVDSNGRILQAGTGEGSDFSASGAEFAGDPTAQIAPLWGDWLTGPIADVWFNDTGAFTSVTWDNVPEFGTGSSATFQVQLFPDHSFVIVYEDVTGLDSIPSTLLTGVSPGGVADPGEIDISGSVGIGFGTDIGYELFDPLGGDLLDLPTSVNAGLSVTVSRPAIATTLEADVVDTNGAATGAVYFLGFPTGLFVPTINLGILSPQLAQCELLNDIVTPGATVAQAVGTVGTPTTLIAIPNSPVLVGVSGLVVSALALVPGASPALLPTDELVLTFGN